MAFEKPKPLHIYAEWSDGKHSGIARLRPAATEDEARETIAADKAAMAETFGGLIAGSRGSRTYRVFRAEWSEVTL